MCGVAGILDLKAKREIDRNALKRMTDALAHRGPDGEGRFIAPGVGFGHRRLAVIDREGGAQPFHAQSGGVLSFNGEIYNYQALAAELKDRVEIKTRSDTEVLAEGLALEGADFLHKLRGMFAFSFWEPGARRLTLARDRLGERPLYYAVTRDDFLIFASEIGALAASRMIDAAIDPRAFADYCFYGWVPDPKSIYRGVFKLPPGHTLTVEGGAMRFERYWRPVFAGGVGVSFDDAADMLRARLDETVRMQMVSDAPLGAFLSGGVDSAGVVSAMAGAGGRVVACTIGFSETGHDERPFARETAERFNAVHHEDEAALCDADLIDDAAAAMGEPFADSSALASLLAARLARRHVTVALTGDGGDEIFAGYRRHPFFLMEEGVRARVPAPLRRMMFGPAGALYPKLDWAPRPLRFKTTFQALARSDAEGYAAAVAATLPGRFEAMLSPDLKRALGGYRPQTVVADAMSEAETDDPLARAQYADLATWLPGRMLTKVDRTAMACGLETRPPLLDHKLVEWAGALPSAYKLKGGDGKRVWKRALEPRLDRELLTRKKQGFALPVRQWLRAEKDNPLDRLAASERWRESGLFNAKAVDRMARAHRRGAADNGQELWTVMMFDAFLRAAQRD